MKHSPARRAFVQKCVYLLSALSLPGCGGGGSSPSATVVPPPPDPTPEPGVQPSILTQPLGQTIAPGETAVFHVVADGTLPLSYQWRRDGISIPGANDTSYATGPAALGDDAVFSVTVSNQAGLVSSQSAALSVVKVAISVDSTLYTVDSLSVTVDGT